MTAFYRTDRFGNPLGRLGYVYSAQRDRTTNGTDVLDISCKTQCDKGDRIVFIDSAGNPREYIITDLEQTREDSLDFTYHCSNSITELALFFIEERRSRSENAQQMLTRVLAGTRWHVGNVTTGGANNLSFYHVSAYQAILDICELWGLEWETQLTISADGSHINGRSINLVPHIGSTSARRFDFGKNLVGLSRTVDSTNVITRLYPYGNSVQETDASGEATGGYSRKIDISSVNGGKTYIEDTAATLVWGVPDASGQVQPAMGMQEYDADDPATLLAMAQADLPNLTQPKVSYTATVATLGIEGVDRYGIGVGDDVYVNDTAYPTPIRLKGRVLEIVDDLVDPLSDDTQITLGNLVETYTADMDRVSGIVDMLTSNSGIWNDAANATPSYIDSVIAGLNQQLNQTGGYVYLEPNEGLIVYDRPKDENPTMAIQLGGGYFRIANSKKSDGSWDWRTAGTGAGLVADVLVAGIIAGGSNWWNLETGDLSFTQGTIGRSDGSTYWNLTTGDFRFAPTSSIGDTGNTIGGTVISTNVQYGLSDNENTVPSSWKDTAEWSKGKVLWSRTMSKSADETVTYGTPQVIIGANGNGVSSVREQYYLSQSNTTQTGGSWGYAQPAWVKGRYYWTRSEITWSDGSISYTTPVLANALTSGNQSTNDLDSALNQQGVFNRLTNNGALEGLYMEAGRLYINASYMKAGILTDNVGRNFWNLKTGEFSLSATNTEIGGVAASDIVVSVDVQYGLSTSETTEPTSWGTSAQWSPGHCLWSRQKITLLNDAVVYSEASRITDLNGMGAYSVREQYYLSTSNTTQSGGSWSYSQPAWVKGRYYWTRSEITMSDGSKQYTTPVLATALTSGNQSTDDLDTALNQQEVFNRLTNHGALQGIYMSGGQLYINAEYLKTGILTDNRGYNFWNLNTGEFSLRGSTQVGGKPLNGTVISVDLEYGLSSSTSSQPTSWSTSAQWEPNRCLWSRQKLTMLDGSIKYTTPSRITDLNGMGAYTVREQYYLSTSSSSQSGGSWSYAQPSWVNGRYYWTRSEITMSDGSKQYTTPVLASGLTSGNQSTTDLDNSLNQLDVFNRLTNNGQTQGLYLSDGLLYINGQYIKANSITSNSIAAGQFSGYVFTGAIYQSSTAENTGFKLRDSGLDMWDSNHNHTVHLDGNGGDNLLTGTFQTALNGRRVRISPDFTQHEITDPDVSIIGSGVQFFLDGDAEEHPYIATESSVSDEGQVSAVYVHGGLRGADDPGAYLRVGERGASGSRRGTAYMAALQKYADASSSRAYLNLSAPASSGAGATLRADNGKRYAGCYANSQDAYLYAYAGDNNGVVGMQADIDTGYLYLGGYLGGITGRHTFQSVQWRMRTGSTPHNYAGETTWTFGTPAKYGTYVGVASADTDWAGIIVHPFRTNSASGMGIKLFNADIDTTVDIYAAALAWLKK